MSRLAAAVKLAPVLALALAVLAFALAVLAMPAGAGAQTAPATAPAGGNGSTLSSKPPVSLGSRPSRAKARLRPPAPSATKPTRLPKTGYDVVEVGLLGLVLVLLGVGVRLRTRDVRWG